MVAVTDAMAMPHAQSNHTSLVFAVFHVDSLNFYNINGNGWLLSDDFERLVFLRLAAEKIPDGERHMADFRGRFFRNGEFAHERGRFAGGYVSEIEELAVKPRFAGERTDENGADRQCAVIGDVNFDIHNLTGLDGFRNFV